METSSIRLIHTKDHYLTEINSLIHFSDSIEIAVAFIGKGTEDLFSAYKNKKIRLITNLMSGATNPETIEHLLNSENFPSLEIRHHSKLHAKVICGHDSMIVGSANFSSNGLGYEDEEAGWYEMGLRVYSRDQVMECKNWYQNMWDLSDSVTEEDLEKARANWIKHRNNRKVHTVNNKISSILDFDTDIFKDRNVYIVSFAEYSISEEAKESLKLSQHDKSDEEIEDLPTYEGYDKLPNDSYFLDLFSGSTKTMFDEIYYGIQHRNFTYKKDMSPGTISTTTQSRDKFEDEFCDIDFDAINEEIKSNKRLEKKIIEVIKHQSELASVHDKQGSKKGFIRLDKFITLLKNG